MEEQVTQEAEAASAARAGYERRAGIKPAPQPEPVKTEQPPADTTASPAPAAEIEAPAAVVDDEPSLEAEPVAPSPTENISSQLEDLKAQVRELKSQGVDPNAVQRLFGEIGGITRIVNKLQKQLAPTDNELAGAIAAAEKAAQEYPEIGGPMLSALKALAAQLPEKPTEPEPTQAPIQSPAPQAAPPAEDPYTPEQKAAIKFLNDLHPDRFAINQSPEFNKWLAAKGRDYEQKFKSGWDFAHLAKGYSDFKAAQAIKQRRQQQLEASQTPQGVAGNQPSVLPDTAGYQRGYHRAKTKRHF